MLTSGAHALIEPRVLAFVSRACALAGRKELAKTAKSLGEDGKVAIRNIRKGANSDVKKQGKDLSEDVAKDANNEIQKLTDKLIKSVDEVVAAKEKEIMTV